MTEFDLFGVPLTDVPQLTLPEEKPGPRFHHWHLGCWQPKLFWI
jgi:hypothetical protein